MNKRNPQTSLLKKNRKSVHHKRGCFTVLTLKARGRKQAPARQKGQVISA